MKKINEKGITLVALVITIIVMLILVGVSITVALNGGLLDTTKEAARRTAILQISDLAQSDVTIKMIDTGNISKDDLKVILDKYFKDVPEALPTNLADLKLTEKDEFGGINEGTLTEIYSEELINAIK